MNHSTTQNVSILMPSSSVLQTWFSDALQTSESQIHFSLSQVELLLLRQFSRGQYSSLANQSFRDRNDFEATVEKLGDALLLFLVRELSVEEDCESPVDAAARIRTAIQTLSHLHNAMIRSIGGEDAVSQ